MFDVLVDEVSNRSCRACGFRMRARGDLDYCAHCDTVGTDGVHTGVPCPHCKTLEMFDGVGSRGDKK